MSTGITPAIVRRLADMHAVYRMFDHGGALLYVGISGRAGRRFDEHAVKRWFPLVSVITLEWHDTYAAAVLAEKRAIATEKPRYNIAGSPFAPKPIRKKAKTIELPPLDADDVLGDVLAVFEEEERHLHWVVILERLQERFPKRWARTDFRALAAQCRALGIPSVQCRMGISVRAGCRKHDVADGVIHGRTSA